MLFDLAGWLGPKGWLAIAIAGIAKTIADYMDSKVTKASKESDAFAEQAITAYKSGNIKEGDRLKELSVNRELQASVLSSGDGFGVGLTRSPIQEKRIKAMQDARNTAAGTPTVPPPPPKPQSWFDKLFDIDFTPPTPPVKKAAGGLVTGPGTGKSDSISARLSNGEFVINADMVKKLGLPFLNKLNTKAPMLSTGISKAQELSAGGAGGLLSMVQNRLGGKAGGMMSSISNLFTGGGSTTSNLMGMASKIPGIGGLLGKATGLLSGGGGLGGMASGLLGKIGMGGLSSSLLGGLAGGPVSMLGSLAAPLLKKIPFVGGALASIAGGPGKLMGSALSKIGGLFGKKKGGMNLSSMVPSNMMQTLSGMGPMAEGVNFPAMLAQMMGGQQPQQTSTAPVTVDTSGIEQKLNNFIAALQGIQINMDGAQVGKVLVNYSDTAGTTGILRPRSNATF
jgi:hypothetical protein